MDLDALARSMGPLQERIRQAEAERAEARITGNAGGGAVRITLKGDLSVEAVSIAPAAAAAVGDDPGMIEDLVAVALGDALRQYSERFGGSPEEQMQRSLGGDLGSLLGPLMGGLGA